MGQAQFQRLFDALDDHQRIQLDTIKGRIKSFGKSYSDSGSGDQAVDILESWLMDDEQKQTLRSNPWDVFFLLAAANLLSFDGAGAYNSREKDVSKNTTARISIPESTKSGWSALDIENGGQTEILELIGKGFFAADGLADEIPPRVLYAGKHDVNIQLLTACLRLAMDFNLKAPGTLNHLRKMLPQSAVVKADCPLDQHFSQISAGAHPHVQATILVQIDCRDAEVHRALKRYESYLQRLLYDLNRIVRPRFLFTAVRFEITPQGYQPIDFKFGVDTSSSLQLFAGNTLYRDRRVFLRELVQNAVDACNLRHMREPGFTPAIGIEFSPDLDRITFRDNGIGMSKQWIKKSGCLNSEPA